MNGSAPRARGTPGQPDRRGQPERISPACAGNTSWSPRSPGGTTDQPRVRGEHITRATGSESVNGSAPRARGTRQRILQWLRLVRISPACAGNTPTATAACWPMPDQPRVRGEHSIAVLPPILTCGSAPRARGTRRDETSAKSRRRISPACAGNTAGRGRAGVLRADQPRVRGEHAPDRGSGLSSDGSAPRARGTPGIEGLQHRLLRISPACAGNTILSDPSIPPVTDQPRVRGEHNRARGTPRAVNGSAPRARGTLALGERHRRQSRISPACAGNTPDDPVLPVEPPDQPRVRGEHVTGPWTRSTASRISPACAGNTSATLPPQTEAADQPRVRGEHGSRRTLGPARAGSAPRARGTRSPL